MPISWSQIVQIPIFLPWYVTGLHFSDIISWSKAFGYYRPWNKRLKRYVIGLSRGPSKRGSNDVFPAKKTLFRGFPTFSGFSHLRHRSRAAYPLPTHLTWINIFQLLEKRVTEPGHPSWDFHEGGTFWANYLYYCVFVWSRVNFVNC